MSTRRSCRLPACAGFGETLEVTLPKLVLTGRQVVEVIPRINTRRVAVGKSGAKRVVAYGLDVGDRDVALAGLQGFLAGSMPPHFGGRRIHAQKFIRKTKASAVGEGQLEDARCLMQLDLRRQRGVGV